MTGTTNNFNHNSEKRQDLFYQILQIYQDCLQEYQGNTIATELLGALYFYFEGQGPFVPIQFSWNEENKKIEKKPLVKWKDPQAFQEYQKWFEIILKNFQKKVYHQGLAFLLDHLPVVVLDIDNVQIFNEKVYDVEKFLNTIKEITPLVVKSIQKGYHIYLPKSYFQNLIPYINNKELIETYGFEIRHQGLIIIPPSCFQHNGKLYSYEILHVSPENLNLPKETITNNPAFQQIFSILENYKFVKEQERLQREYKAFTQKNEENRRNYQDLKEIIEEVKRRLSFEDLIPEHLHRKHGHYDTYHCPFHPPDKSSSFAVYRMPDGVEIAKDFHDDKAYDVIAFWQEYKNLDFIETLKDLCDKARIKFPEYKPQSKKKKEKEKVKHVKEISPEEEEALETIRENTFFETNKAFYTSAFAISKSSRRRFALFKEEKELWEILEIQKTFREFEDLREDSSYADEIIIFQETQNSVNENTLYSYLIIKKEKHIGNFYIESGVENVDELGGETRYDLTLSTSKNGKRITVENIATEELLSKLKNENLVVSNQKIRDALAKTITDLIKAEKIKQKVGISKVGFFYHNDKILLSKITPSPIDIEKVKEALYFLTELVEIHFGHVREKFATVLKWFLISPFSYLVKQKKNMIKALYLFGASGTGKSTMSLICAAIWKNHHRIIEKAGSAIDTVARIGNVLSTSTFPEIISEPQGALLKEEVVETLKNALTGTIARAKFTQGQYREIPALANLCFTSNHFLPKDDALIRRFYIVSFSKKERPQNSEFFSQIKAKVEELLPLIGDFFVSLFAQEDEFLKKLIFSITEENFMDIAREILVYLHQKAGFTAPEWVDYIVSEDYDLQEYENEERVSILLTIKKEILREMEKIRFDESLSMPERLKEALEKQIFSFILYKNGTVYLTKEVLTKIGGKVANLKLLAELMEWQWKEKHSIRTGNSFSKISVICFPVEEFINLIFPTDSDNFEIEEQETSRLDYFSSNKKQLQ